VARTNLETAVKNVLVHEGGWSNHPRDPGKATMRGVTQKVYDAYRDRQNATRQSVRHITNLEVATIYKQQYWDVIRGNDLPTGIDYVVFDGAVNSGPGQSVKWLQRALGVRADGVMGQVTLAAVQAHPDYVALVDKILALRLAFLKALETWDDFGKGWTRRLAGVRRYGLAMVTAQEPEGPIFIEQGNAKAEIEQACKPPSKAPGDLIAGGGVITTTLPQVIDGLTPLSYLPQIATVITVLTVVGVIATAAGMLYRQWAASRTKTLEEALS
jgi:lysozyme family protein